jgi:fatty acid-binding protein DegV
MAEMKNSEKIKQHIKEADMEPKNQILKWLALLFILMAGSVGAIAQTNTDAIQTVCIGDEPYRVNDTPSSIYTWSISPGTDGVDWKVTGNGTSKITMTWITPNLTTGYALKVVETTVAGCIGDVISVQVFVNPIPVITDPGSFTVCNGAITNIPLATTTTGATVLYKWTVSGSSGNVSGFSDQATAVAGPIAQTLTNNGLAVEKVTYIVTPVIGDCTGTPVTVVVTVNPTPIMTDPADETICSTGATNISLASTNTGATVDYTWSVSGSSANVTGFTEQITPTSGPIVQTLTNTGLAVETVTYVITPLIGTCTGTPVNVVVTVNPIPVLTNPGPFTICNAATTNIPLVTTNAGATVEYTWTATGSSANVTGFSNQVTAVSGPIAQTLTNNGSAVETVTYTITPVIGTCSGTPVSVVVTVNPTPILTNPGSFTICNTVTTNIPLVTTNTGATVEYTWTASGSSANVTGFSPQATAISGPIAQTLTNSGLAVEKVTYTITPEIGTCTGTPVTVEITVNPTPVMTHPADETICNAGVTNIPLESTNTGATVLYTWTAIGSSVNVTGFTDQATANAGPIAQTLTNSGLAVEKVTYTITPVIGTCTGNPVTVEITVNPTPVMTDPADVTICSATATNILLATTNTSATVEYTWTATGSSANVTGFSNQATAMAGPIAQTLTNSGLAVETVTYTITPVIGTCTGTPVTVVVSVNPAPVMIAAPDVTICYNGNTNIPLTTTNTGVPVLYTWTATGSSANVTGYSAQATAIAGPIAQSLNNSGLAVETVTYTITPVIGACTGTPVTVVVTVNPAPVITQPLSETICSAAATNIPLGTTNTGTPVLYTWTVTGSSANVTGFSDQATAIAGPIAHTLTNNGLAVEKVTYTITPVIGSCTGTPVTVEITVNPTPIMTDPLDETICYTGDTNIPLATTNTGATVSYTWTVTASTANVTGFSAQATASAGPIIQTLTNNGTSFDSVTYVITPVIGTCNGTPVNVVVKVDPKPNTSIIYHN